MHYTNNTNARFAVLKYYSQYTSLDFEYSINMTAKSGTSTVQIQHKDPMSTISDVLKLINHSK